MQLFHYNHVVTDTYTKEHTFFFFLHQLKLFRALIKKTIINVLWSAQHSHFLLVLVHCLLIVNVPCVMQMMV